MRLNLDSLLNSFKDHSGTICAVAAVAGVFVTAYFSGKAAVEAKEKVKPEMETKEKVKTYAKAYAKTAVAAGVTCGLIIGSDRIHVGKELALAGVATMWKDKYISLDKKMVEEVGEERATEIKKEIIKDKMKENPPKCAPEKHVPGGLIQIYEPYTDQYITTTRERIAWAMYEANKKLQDSYEVKMNFIIDLLGGLCKPEGDYLGWNLEHVGQNYAWSCTGSGIPWIEPIEDIYTSDDGTEALALFYFVEPEDLLNHKHMAYREECGSK